ncbi:GntR family transcriptional regulator [Micrococcus luteus]|uniref:GntR family transcriptional regulator n=1 Tax=Micrococcus luteus TaxID=1270 RepID=UPI0006678BCB|nr:GntR family transcriptional regulator [Micrococcus luteus]MCV7511976.1 GntR family transcriptional regulator [Micrococcus luteus]MCV7520564.1 GntR family transcriptional regulator [Micrococcus luteus]MCV7571739.1 GntR family transcriptional regulator [Micrococcus luteus]PFH05752.1 GntR family transcriptional regulator [Micrococcaceae bacterium JKS001869]
MAEPAVEIDLRSPVPPFEQIRARIADLVAAGELPAGTRLPSVRALAGDLGIAPNTVVRAYRELEAAGVVRTARGKGTVVADAPPAPDDAAVGAAVERAVALARAAGWDAARLRRAVDDAQRVCSDR